MRVDLDKYLARAFDLADYNCWHLTRDVWMDLTGDDLGERTPEMLSRAALIGAFETSYPVFELLTSAAEPSIAVMTRRRSIPHCGVFVGGRIIQHTQHGVTYLPPAFATVGFERVEYYR